MTIERTQQSDRGFVPAEGGKAAWSPSVMPPIGVELTRAQQLACAFRILAGVGFSENIAGHITWAEPDGSMWVNPWGLWWNEITASDLCRVSPDGEVLEGKWDVTPAIHIHTELHRIRADARVVVHNHPYWATVLTSLVILPEVLHQTGCLFEGDLGFVNEYTGEVANAALGEDLAQRIGDATTVFLANHGVIVTAPTIEEAVYRAASIDRMCKITYDVIASGREHTTIAPSLRKNMRDSLVERGSDVYWAGAVRTLLRDEQEVLD